MGVSHGWKGKIRQENGIESTTITQEVVVATNTRCFSFSFTFSVYLFIPFPREEGGR